MSLKPTTITARPGTPFIDVVRDFDATPAQVFRASTDPELVAEWLGPRNVEIRISEYDVRPGGRYRYIHRDPDGTEYAFRGVFHTVTADELVIQTFEYDGWPGQVSLESTTFEDLGGTTRLHTHSVFPSVEARDAMIESGMEHGIRDSMDRLAEVVGPAPVPPAPSTPRGRVVVDISMSLDGYVAAAGVDEEHGLGVGGEVLHAWAVDQKTARDAEILDASVARTGAVIMGRRTFDFVDGPNGWSDEMGYGAERDQSAAPPVFVVTHSAPEKVRLGDRFSFATDGLDRALAEAKAAAGDKDVVIMGGGNTAYGFLRAGLVDVLSVHLAPVVLGGGTPLFPAGESTPLRLELTDSFRTATAEHLTYRVINGGEDA
ncbi:SRPBCC domain-containing protein [Plantactinospora solaniradicis]|uniref:SRPBCC domain-containing protein n=1 Tax=Plantactinospora solaniradicis TaxID=1723736 RepID=A0ABW1KCE1_9ACTN